LAEAFWGRNIGFMWCVPVFAKPAAFLRLRKGSQRAEEGAWQSGEQDLHRLPDPGMSPG
jgi:hypothetical protein